MLLYNTTFHVDDDVQKNFLIWLKEVYVEEIKKTDLLSNPRLCRILSHKEEGSESFSLQWEVESSGTLHRWHVQQGAKLNEELSNIFKDKVVGIPTLMEVME